MQWKYKARRRLPHSRSWLNNYLSKPNFRRIAECSQLIMNVVKDLFLRWVDGARTGDNSKWSNGFVDVVAKRRVGRYEVFSDTVIVKIYSYIVKFKFDGNNNIRFMRMLYSLLFWYFYGWVPYLFLSISTSLGL